LRDHPTHETLDRFLRGELSTADSAGVVAHFLRGCRFCQAAVAEMAGLLFEKGEPEDLGDDGAIYEESIDRAVVAARRAATALDDEIYAALVAKGHSAIQASRFRGVPVCRALMRRSWELRHEDPTQMLQLAHFAVLTAARLDPERVGAAQLAEIRARALAQYGNAQRILGDLSGAERSVEQALALYQSNAADPLLGAHLLTIRAAVFDSQRRFSEALELLEKVEQTYKEHGERHAQGRALVQRGLYTGYRGEAEEGVRLLRAGLALIDETVDPQLALAAIHNLALLLSESGQLREARILLWENRERYDRHAERIMLLKRTWLEGYIAAGLGDLERAVERLSAVIHAFEEAELGYQAALAALDLGAVWLRQNRAHAAFELIEHAAETFVAIGVGREALGALALLQQACEQESVDVALVHQVSAFLRRLEHDPGARFSQR
jgi:tetratricopeptide (TPR) repeat protein